MSSTDLGEDDDGEFEDGVGAVEEDEVEEAHDQAERELGGEEGEEPGGGVQRGWHLQLLQVPVQLGQAVVQQPLQLVLLHLQP